MPPDQPRHSIRHPHAAKRLRWTLWHTPGRLTRSGRRTTIRLPTNHPGAPHLARIYNHTNAAAASTTKAPPNSMLPSPCTDH